MPSDMRIGLGTDLHRLVEGRSLWLGGVEIPSDKGADAHSDGDVVLHALTDALLGAAAISDIGELFPDTDPALAGIASATMISEALAQVHAAGWSVVNVDVVVELQSPKLRPHRDSIRARLAELIAVSADRVFVKAKTGEGLGAVGEGRAVSAQAVVLLEAVK